VMNFDEKVLIIDENDFERSEHRLKKRKWECENCEIFTFTFIDSWFLPFVGILCLFTDFVFWHCWVSVLFSSDVLWGDVRSQTNTKNKKTPFALISSFVTNYSSVLNQIPYETICRSFAAKFSFIQKTENWSIVPFVISLLFVFFLMRIFFFRKNLQQLTKLLETSFALHEILWF
jgi:hypothetical protein